MSKLGIHSKLFGEKVRLMNQTHNKSLTMTSEEARNLHTEIFDLLAKIVELSDSKKELEINSAAMDGGTF